jgi:TolB-like protein/Flp pilus assembly protein TadD
MGVAVVSAVVLIALLSRYPFFKSKADREHAGPIESIAVLPLVNLSSDPAQEYFSDGLTDELITELAKIGTLRVISHTSADSYKGTGKRIPAIASELHVDAIVEGTIERAGDKVRIRAQLVRGAADQHLWAESYDGDVGNLLQLESEVARDIAKQIGYVTAQQSGEAGKKLVIPASAHEDYLRGRYHWNKRTEAGLRKGIEYFQKAIEQEPNYALAYAGLADSYIMLANWGFAPPGDSYPKAKAAAQQALELDPQLAEAQTSLAYVTLLYEWNWTEAERRFRQAIAINPNYASAHQFYSICLMTAGRQPAALEEIHRAQQLDPLSLIVSDVLGWIYYEGRQYDQAVAQYKKTLEMDPGYVPALLDLGTSYLRTGDYNKAIEQFQKAKSLQGSNGVVLSGLAQAYALSGKREDARKILKQLNEPSKSSFISAWDLSLVYSALGEKKKAIEMLGKAADEHVGWVVRLGIDPAFDSLRDDPEFQNLKQRVGVPGSL